MALFELPQVFCAIAPTRARLCGLDHLLVALAVAALGACGSDPAPQPAGDAAQTDGDSTAGVDDTVKDSTAADLGPGVDAGNQCLVSAGGPGCPCKGNSDCDNAFCIDTPEGKQCARNCIDNCPDGFACSTVSGSGGDLITICVAKFGRRCDPCTISKDCVTTGTTAAACIAFGQAGDEGAFCGSPCQDTADCGKGFSCSEVTAVEGQKVKQCVPDPSNGHPGVCTCSVAAKSAGLQTKCMVQAKDKDGKVIGNCAGTRQCASDGLTACAAPDPATEVCDGVDNDCNGVTDDATCNDKNTCTQDLCKPDAGGSAFGCAHAALGGPCDADVNVCTQNDFCLDGGCKPGPAKDCSDGNPCTKDSCDTASGCTQTADDGVACSDGNACTVGDSCFNSLCQKGADKNCDANKPCIIGSCDLSGGNCVFTNKQDGVICDDGLICSVADKCAAGVCAGDAKNCDDGNGCTLDSCDPTSGCVNAPTTAPCDDGTKCTAADVCKAGVCAGIAINCDDGNQCTDDKCDPLTACSNTATTGPCSDNDACTLADACSNTVCVSGPNKICNDNSSCTQDSCDPVGGLCKFDGSINEGAACDADSSVCTVSDKCIVGKCTAGKAKLCDDGNACTDDGCDALTGCTKVNNISLCNSDDNPCTQNDICVSGACKTGKDKVCDDNNGCTSDSCDPNTIAGTCIYSAVALNGSPCDADNSNCTISDSCILGKCTAGKQKNCDDANACTDDACDPKTGCSNSFNVDVCDDGAPCTVGDSCKNGTCLSGKPKVCDDKNPCTFDNCDTNSGVCLYDIKPMEASPCDADGSICTEKDKCIVGKCTVGPLNACDDNNVCSTDTCDAKLGCLHVYNTIGCNDGDACTTGDVCKGGSCAGVPANCDDLNTCTTDSCDKATGCKHVTIADGTLCNPDSVCVASVCKPTVCGDGIVQGAVEKCDGLQLGGNICASVLGVGSDGTLKCGADCKSWDTLGCNVDTSWMDTTDNCKGYRQAGSFPTVHFAVGKSNIWDKAKNYNCPKGSHWATTAEGDALFKPVLGGNQAVYSSQCGWLGDMWPIQNGTVRSFFRFADSAKTFAYKHVADQEQSGLGSLDSTAKFAGIVCIAP